MFGFVTRTPSVSGLLLAVGLVAVSWTPALAQDAGLPGLEGGRLTEESLAEGDTIVVVWASWSPRSRNIGPRIAALAASWGKRARVITVNFQESAERARTFAREQKIEVPIYLDGDAAFAKRFAVTSLPFLLVLRDGEPAFAGKLPADPGPVIERALG